MLTKEYIDKLLEKYPECPVCGSPHISIKEENDFVVISCQNREKHDNKPYPFKTLANINK
jgi:hypothetical protein